MALSAAPWSHGTGGLGGDQACVSCPLTRRPGFARYRDRTPPEQRVGGRGGQDRSSGFAEGGHASLELRPPVGEHGRSRGDRQADGQPAALCGYLGESLMIATSSPG